MAVPADESGPGRFESRATPQIRQPPLRIVIVNDVYHPGDAGPAAALDRFSTLTGWADAICAEGADVLVCQRFHRDARLTRGSVVYRFFADAHPPRPPQWFAGSDAVSAAVTAFQPAAVHVNGMDYPRPAPGKGRGL